MVPNGYGYQYHPGTGLWVHCFTPKKNKGLQISSEQKECRLRKSEKELQGTNTTVLPHPVVSYGSHCGNWMNIELTFIETGYFWVYCELNPRRLHMFYACFLSPTRQVIMVLVLSGECSVTCTIWLVHDPPWVVRWLPAESWILLKDDLELHLGPAFSASPLLGLQVCAHCAWFIWCWRSNPKLPSCQATAPPTEQCLQLTNYLLCVSHCPRLCRPTLYRSVLCYLTPLYRWGN